MVLGSNPVAVTSPSDFAPALSKEFLDIQATIECGFTLKRIRDMTRTYSVFLKSKLLRKYWFTSIKRLLPTGTTYIKFNLKSHLLPWYAHFTIFSQYFWSINSNKFSKRIACNFSVVVLNTLASFYQKSKNIQMLKTKLLEIYVPIIPFFLFMLKQSWEMSW